MECKSKCHISHIGIKNIHIGEVWDKGYTYKGYVMQNDKRPWEVENMHENVVIVTQTWSNVWMVQKGLALD